jgi:hypothetical protein
LPKEKLNQKFNEAKLQVVATMNKTIEKQFGLSQDEIDNISEADKKDSYKYLSKAYEIVLKRNNPDLAKMQTDLMDMRSRLEESENEKQNLKETLESEYQKKLTATEARILIMQENTSLVNEVIGDAGAIFPLIYPKLSEKYTLVIENGLVDLRKKENPSFKVEKKEGKGFMTVKDALIEEYKSMKLYKEAKQPAGEPIKVSAYVTPNEEDRFKSLIEKERAKEKNILG